MIYLSRVLRILWFFALVGLPGRVGAASYNATAIVDFFCDEAGRSLAVLAFRDKANGVPMNRNMHQRPTGFLQHLDNEIIRTVYRQSATEEDARRLGFRVCVALMIGG